MRDDSDRTASLMTPAKLAQLKMRQPAPSPAAWLDKLAADAGSAHVRRLLDLRRQLENQLGADEYARLAAGCASLADKLLALDFGLLRPRGWLARATGKEKAAVATFVAQHEQGSRAADELRAELRTLARRQQQQVAVVERSVVEFLVEVGAIEKIVDQGTRWLHDMRNQLRQREAGAAAGADAQKTDEDRKRCELLVVRLKQLRAAHSAANQVAQQGREASARRGATIDGLQRLLEADWANVQGAVGELADRARATGVVGGDPAKASQAQAQLAGALRQAASDCEALQSQSQNLLAALEAVQEPLRSAT